MHSTDRKRESIILFYSLTESSNNSESETNNFHGNDLFNQQNSENQGEQLTT